MAAIGLSFFTFRVSGTNNFQTQKLAYNVNITVNTATSTYLKTLVATHTNIFNKNFKIYIRKIHIGPV